VTYYFKISVGVLSISLSSQQLLHMDFQIRSSERVYLSSKIVKTILDCFTEILKVMDLAILSHENASLIKDRCFVCYNRIEELKSLLLASLAE
jgi:hypothetical protein